ncbi:GNAT family N-acetyltransferase, partial [Pedobacter sp. JCM 36344]|uniref:GNAT family N-acetyltransferase n=1 Tax=Pedobacter sp. JCM 36344 TaxID=3374280 RepID=UPI00397CF7DC
MLESKAYLKKYIEGQNEEPRKEYGLCVSLANHEPIGLIGLSNGLTKFKNAELWFKLHPDYWGHGYSTEAVLPIMKYGFEKLL